MNHMSLRLILDPLLGAALSVAFLYTGTAAGRPTPVVKQFAARAVSVSGTEDAGRIGIYIERWSTDKDVDSLRALLAQGDPARLVLTLEQQHRRAGVVLMPGVQGHGSRVRERTPKNLLFAREIDTPAGRRLIVASDERLGLGESQIDARKEISEFNLMEIRFGPDGTGVGKVADATDVVYNPETRSFEVKDYPTRPARLVDVKVDKF